MTEEKKGTADEFRNWQRKFLMHCVHVAKTINADEAIASADRLEFVGAPLLDGLTNKVRAVLEKAKAEGKL